jgi:hypothetical protein
MTRVLKPAARDRWGNVVLAGLALLPAALVGWAGLWVLGVSAVVLAVLILGRACINAGRLQPAPLRCLEAWLAYPARDLQSPRWVPRHRTTVVSRSVGRHLRLQRQRPSWGWRSRAAVLDPLSRCARGFDGCSCDAMSLFYINTYYVAALPLWLVAAALRRRQPSPVSPELGAG